MLTPDGSATVVKSHAARAEFTPASNTAAVAAVNSNPVFIGLISALLKRVVDPGRLALMTLDTNDTAGFGGADRGPT